MKRVVTTCVGIHVLHSMDDLSLSAEEERHLTRMEVAACDWLIARVQGDPTGGHDLEFDLARRDFRKAEKAARKERKKAKVRARGVAQQQGPPGPVGPMGPPGPPHGMADLTNELRQYSTGYATGGNPE